MKTQFMYEYFTKTFLLFLLCSSWALAQQPDKKEVSRDTLVFKQKYGLRIGADLNKLVRTFFDDDYSGFELMGDYRLTKRLYLAAELGNETRTLRTDFLDNTTKGSYFKGGIDMNFYKNWLDMENMIYGGLRLGASTFSQTLNNYTIYDVNNQYLGQQYTQTNSTEFSGLTALWIELIIGLKAELVTNLFAGINAQLKFLVADDSPDNYENLYIPGFNRTFDSGSFGVGFGFNISYLVPIFKKDKIVIQQRETQE